MKRITFSIAILIIALVVPCMAQTPQTFKEAKQQAVQQDKPLLIEFFREE